MTSIDQAVARQTEAAEASIRTDALYHRVTLRFVPLLFLAYVFNYLDRTNIAFGQLQMKDDLGFSDLVYGSGASILFVSYAVFALPSNLLLARIGARRIITGCLIGWGIVSFFTILVRTPLQFYIARFLLGVFEAGFFPGVVYYLTRWFPSRRYGRVLGVFSAATVTAGVVGGALAGSIMTYLDSVAGLHGWQWMFALEALPSMFLGVVCYACLDDRPDEARWLSAHDKQVIAGDLAADPGNDHAQSSMRQALTHWRIYLLGIIYFTAITNTYVISFWQPILIRELGVQSVLAIGLFATIPPAVAVLAKILIPYHSDRKNERRWHYAGSAFAGAAGLLLMTMFPRNVLLGVGCLTLATAGVHACIPLFWNFPRKYLSGTAAAGGVAIIHMIGTFGGTVGPFTMGAIRTATGSFDAGMYLAGGMSALGGVLVLLSMAGGGSPVPQRAGLAGTTAQQVGG